MSFQTNKYEVGEQYIEKDLTEPPVEETLGMEQPNTADISDESSSNNAILSDLDHNFSHWDLDCPTVEVNTDPTSFPIITNMLEDSSLNEKASQDSANPRKVQDMLANGLTPDVQLADTTDMITIDSSWLEEFIRTSKEKSTEWMSKRYFCTAPSSTSTNDTLAVTPSDMSVLECSPAITPEPIAVTVAQTEWI